MDFEVVLRTDDEREQDRGALRSLAEAGSDLSEPRSRSCGPSEPG